MKGISMLQISLLIASSLGIFLACSKSDGLIVQYDNTPLQFRELPNPTSIVSGEGIGRIYLGMTTDDLSYLGNPDVETGNWSTWKTSKCDQAINPYELNILFSESPKSADKFVQIIGISAPEIFTENGIGVGSSANDVFNSYPKAQISGWISANPRTKRQLFIEDVSNGIGFSIDPTNQKCTSIYLFSSPKSVYKSITGFYKNRNTGSYQHLAAL